MIKLTKLLEDTILYEGLIFSADIDSVVSHLKTWSMASTKFKIKPTNDNKIILKFDKQPNDKDVINLMRWINTLGWYIARYVLNDGNFDYKSFTTKEELINDLNSYNLLNLILEAKYDLELNKYELKNLYHITPIVYKEKIEKIGLVPKSLSKISYHPERIYLTTSEEDAINLATKFGGRNDKFALYQVDIDKLIKHNNGIRFFKDPNLKSGIYTLSNISPKFLIFKEIVSF
jgi:hypothetical protein